MRIKHLMLEKNAHAKDIADILGIATQSVNNKLYRNSFSFDEVVAICEALGAEVVIRIKDSGMEF